MHVEMGEIEKEQPVVRPKVTDAKGILQQNREFLDFFWDIANPEQEIRLKAIENLIQYLKTSEKPDELKYTLKRLVEGLAHTREAARPGFSLALGQVLSIFEDISLHTILDELNQKHNLQNVAKKRVRNAVFGNYFGVLAMSQSTRLSKEPQVLLGCIQLLQTLTKHREHLKDLPSKTMVEILSETSAEVFEEVLLGTLQSDLTSAFTTPEQLQLLLVAMERFPHVLKPKKLKKLLGTSTVITADNIPKLTEVLRTAARSVKKDQVLPGVALDLLKVALKEDSFDLFWNEAIIKGMFKDQPGPTHFLAYRLLGSSLPLLSLAQLNAVLTGEVMKHYGEHMLSAQLPDRFKFAPEMETYVAAFLQRCEDPDKQLAVMVRFTLVTNHGWPVVPSNWRVVQHLQPAAVQRYVDWLKAMFLAPQLDKCLEFSTRKQTGSQEKAVQKEQCVFRLRKWIVPRLTSIMENQQVKREEDLVMDVARFVFFHAFFNARKTTPDIPETEGTLSEPLDDKTRAVLVSSFFGLLQHMHLMPVLGDPAEETAPNQRHVHGVTADGTLWIYCVVQYADALLNQPAFAQQTKPLSPEQRQTWDSMMESVANLMKKAKKGPTTEMHAFQQLFLLTGIHLFQAPEELLVQMNDLQNCLDKAMEKSKKKKKKQDATEDAEEPHWAEVVVDILLSLLAQPSRHIRHVCKTVFASICPHVTARALTAILDVLDPDQDDEDGAMVVTDDKDDKPKKKKEKKTKKAEDDQDEEMEEEEESDSSDDDSDEEEPMEKDDDDDEVVDEKFRLELSKVLQKENALATEEDPSDDEDLDDEAMMKLDSGLAALFSEQQKKTQAKKDEKTRLQKEKALVRDFKIKVLDLVEVFLAKQGSSPLVLGMVEPLLTVIERGMSSDSDQQEQQFLRKTADIFSNQLCRAKLYCRTVDDRQAELHDLLEKLMTKAQKQPDSSVSLYFFSACLYLVKILRGRVPTAETKDGKTQETAAAVDLKFMGNVDVDRVTAIFKSALSFFMSRRKSPLTGQMFNDLFVRFPVLCVNLLETAVENITAGVREHQQGQACVLVLRGLQSREVQRLMPGTAWTEMCHKAVGQLALSLKQVVPSEPKVVPSEPKVVLSEPNMVQSESKVSKVVPSESKVVQSESKVVQEKMLKALELSHFLVKTIQQKKLSMDLVPLQKVLQPGLCLNKTGQLEDRYWAVMKLFGVIKPKTVKRNKADKEPEQQNVLKKKEKGFLPETKKRKNRPKKGIPGHVEAAVAQGHNPNLMPLKPEGGEEGAAKKKKNKKKRKQQQPGGGGGEATSQPSPAKKAKTQPAGKPPQKKNKKKAKVAGDQ